MSTLESGAVVQQAGESIFDRAVLLSLELGKLGTTKKASLSAVETDVDKGMLHLSKDIIDSPKLKGIARYDAQTRGLLKLRCLPSNFREGMYLLPIALLEGTDNILVSRAAERVMLIDSFLQDYARLCEEGRLRLGSLFNPRDYPSEARVRARFGMSWSYIEMSAPGRLRSIHSEIYRREAEKIQGMFSNAIEEGKAILRSELQSMVMHLAEVLTPNADGTTKRIKAPEDKRSWLTDLQEFLANFRDRDLSGDADMQAVVDDLRRVIGGRSVSAIKTDDAVRDELRMAAGAAVAALSSMVMIGGRSIDLQDIPEGDGSDDWQLV